MPQWDFLNFLAEHGRRYPGFRLLMQAEVTDLIEEGGRVAGVKATTPDGDLAVRAALVVGCDGRHSTVREKAGLAVEEFGAPMDVLWFRLSRRPDDAVETGGVFLPGRIFVMLNRGDYWQCAYVIPKGSVDDVHRRGLDSFRADVARTAPPLADRVAEIASWDQVKLLTVAVDRLKRWYRSGLALHRRRRARHVADRRRRHQPCDPGRGGRRQHSGRAAAARRAPVTRRLPQMQNAARISDPRHPAHAGLHAGARDPQGARRRGHVEAAAVSEAAGDTARCFAAFRRG